MIISLGNNQCPLLPLCHYSLEDSALNSVCNIMHQNAQDRSVYKNFEGGGVDGRRVGVGGVNKGEVLQY